MVFLTVQKDGIHIVRSKQILINLNINMKNMG